MYDQFDALVRDLEDHGVPASRDDAEFMAKQYRLYVDHYPARITFVLDRWFARAHHGERHDTGGDPWVAEEFVRIAAHRLCQPSRYLNS